MTVGTTGCSTVYHAIASLGSYLQEELALWGLGTFVPFLLHYCTFHLGAFSTGQTPDPGADNYCFFAADQVEGPAGAPNQLFLEGTFVDDGGHVTATVTEGAGALATAQAPTTMALDLRVDGDTLTGTAALTINAVTYTGAANLEYAE
ncbi:MAG: hypothetical protein KKI08_13520 [Armatimonadetes bacterium]|nr:hypothetical protein [Armatimonadota bacterium]